MSRASIASLLVVGVLHAPPLLAQSYGRIELQAREGATSNFNLPADADITAITSVTLNDSGTVALRIYRAGDEWTRHLFVGNGGAGGVVYAFPDPDALVGDLQVAADGSVVFEVSQTTASNGPWRWTAASGVASRISTQPLGAQSWEFPQRNAAGRHAARVGFGTGKAWASYDGAVASVHATEAAIDPASPYSFLFTPAFTAAGEIVGRVRLGAAGAVSDSQPDRIVATAPNGDTRVLVRDRDDDPMSPYFAIDNGIGASDDGEVAFIARLGPAGAARGVFATDGTSNRSIAVTGGGVVNEIEFFAPSVNAAGQVVFRARDAAGVQGIFVGDGATVVPVVRRGDVVETDVGTLRIGRPNVGEAAFGGRPALNARGDVAFIADLMTVGDPPALVGRAVFVAYAGPPDRMFGDGFEDAGAR